MKHIFILLFFLFSSLTFGQADRTLDTSALQYKELATPSNPPSGKFKVYIKSDGIMYILNSAGTETPIASGSGGGISQWVTGTNYATDGIVVESNKIYIALTDHLSGTFATDLGNGDWQLIETEAGAVQVTPAGNLVATDAQAALVELQGDIDTNTTAIAGKEDTLTNSAGLAAALSDETGTGLAVFGTSPNITTPTGIVKGDVGLGNVDNTSDANKPVSTATQTALDAKVAGPASSVDGEIVLFDSTTGKLVKSATGSGFVKATSGVYSTSASVDLAADVSTSILPLANGGSSKALTAVNGGVVYSDADSMEVSAAGTSGQILNSVGAGTPTWVNKSISGIREVGSAITLEQLQSPNQLFTQTDSANKYLHETGNNNILANPSFEYLGAVETGAEATTSWYLTAGTGTAEVTKVVHGKKSSKVVLSAATLELYQDSTLYASQFAGTVQGVAMVRVQTTVSGIFVCPRQAGATVLTNCVQVDTSGTWGLYKIPFVLGATSNGIAIVSGTLADGVVTPGNVTGDIYVDDAFVGAANIIDTQPTIGPRTQYTPTFTAFGTVVTHNCYYTQVGAGYLIDCTFTTATTTASEARVSLPNSYTSPSTLPTISKVGTHSRGIASSSIVDHTVLIEPSVGYVTFGLQSASAQPFTKQAGNQLSSGAETISFNAYVPISQLQGSTNTYTAPCGANCVDEFVFSVSDAGVVSSENVDAINGNCAIVANVFTCTLNTALTSPMICSFGKLTANNSGYEGTFANTTTAIVFTPKTDAGALSSVGGHIKCSKTGADFTASRTINGNFKQFANVAYIAGTKANGTDAGASAAGNQTRELTTIISDPNGIVTSLSGNQFTLPAGKYFIEASAPAHSCRHKLKVRNITAGSTVVLNGTTIFAGSNVTTPSIASGVVTISTPSAFDLYHYTSAIVASDGLGVDSSGSGEVEVYSTVKITRLD